MDIKSYNKVIKSMRRNKKPPYKRQKVLKRINRIINKKYLDDTYLDMLPLMRDMHGKKWIYINSSRFGKIDFEKHNKKISIDYAPSFGDYYLITVECAMDVTGHVDKFRRLINVDNIYNMLKESPYKKVIDFEC